MAEQTDFMATWRDLREQCEQTEGRHRNQVQRLMESLLEQYGAELRQNDLNECVGDLKHIAAAADQAATSATAHRRSG